MHIGKLARVIHQGISGIEDGRLVHISDEIEVIREAWAAIYADLLEKFGLKSTCLDVKL